MVVVVKIGFVKLGNIASAPLLEMLLDERADREDIDVRVVSSGAKLGPEQAGEVADSILSFKPAFVVVASPNAALPGPAKVREKMAGAGVPTIVVSDGPSKKIAKELGEKGFGYIIVEGDAMIGARREFLDPVEMAVFNADIIKVLAITGSFHLLYTELDRVVEAVKKGEKPELPKIVVNKEKAVEAAEFQNPYAKVKALAAYEMLRKVAELDVEGCFVVQERERYIPLVAAAHEMVRAASKMADEAREIEKAPDVLLRKPHHKDGSLMAKRKLMEKPQKL
jgi:methylenetetrahydromethanopterin dehydrogenase